MKIPMFSPSYSSLVQMNNSDHIVHPGVLPDPGKAKATLELAKAAVRLDPVDSRAHLCCGWSYVWASREAEAAPHMELACELNDNDPVDLVIGCALLRFLRIDRAGSAVGRAVARTFAGAALSWMGLPRHHPFRLWRLCRRHRGHRSRPWCHTHLACMAGRRIVPSRAAGHGAGRGAAFPQRNPFILGWFIRADRRGRDALGAPGPSDQHTFAVGNPARWSAWRRASGRGIAQMSQARGFRSRS